MKERTDRFARFTIVTALTLAGIAMAASAGWPQSQNAAPETPYHKTDPLKPPGPPLTPRPMATRLPSRPAALVNIRILPASMDLVSPRFTQRLVVEGTFADGHQEDLTSKARLSSS